jgi:hypothetical protein
VEEDADGQLGAGEREVGVHLAFENGCAASTASRGRGWGVVDGAGRTTRNPPIAPGQDGADDPGSAVQAYIGGAAGVEEYDDGIVEDLAGGVAQVGVDTAVSTGVWRDALGGRGACGGR